MSHAAYKACSDDKSLLQPIPPLFALNHMAQDEAYPKASFQVLAH
jgi:hypothetical protein